VQVGLMDDFTSYPGTTKDYYQLNPRWPAVIILLLGTAVFYIIGRWLVRRFNGDAPAPGFKSIKSLAFLVISLVGIFLLVADPFALIFLVPLLFWFLVGGRHGIGKVLDIILLLLGGLVFYALIYFFGFQTLHYGFGFLWYFICAISIGMFKFVNVAAGAAIIAAGLSMLVTVPKGSARE